MSAEKKTALSTCSAVHCTESVAGDLSIADWVNYPTPAPGPAHKSPSPDAPGGSALLLWVFGNCGRIVHQSHRINDAVALRDANVGISVDAAVDIAKESADIVLLIRQFQDVVIAGLTRNLKNSLKKTCSS
jgi:hypothetical protein